MSYARPRLTALANLASLVTLVWICVAPGAALAEPYMALREGFACGDCHTNRSGGGMRTLTAEMHAADVLRLPNDGQGILPAHDDWFSPNINEWISVGANFRLTESINFQDDPDENGEVDNNTAFRELESSDFDVERATLYAHLRLIPDMLSVYIDEQVAPGGASNRELWGMLEGVLPWDIYIKGGRFFPAFGLKIEDDEAFVNSFSGFNFDRTLSGIEVGRTGMGWNWMLSFSEGGDDLEHLWLGSLYYLWADVGPFNGLMLGSSAGHYEPRDLEANSFTAFGGASVGPFTWLVQGLYIDGEEKHEVDVTTARDGYADFLDSDTLDASLLTDLQTRGASTTELITRGVDSWGVYTELNTLVLGWMNVKFAFDYLDPSDNQGEDQRNRFSIGLEPFLDRFLQLRLFYRILNGPKDQPATNRDELILEAHLFF